MGSLNILVVGECGDGKSTLIKKLAVGEKIPEVGMDSKGVTKQIEKYDAGKIGDRTVTLLDSPGVGDKDITPGKLVTMIEEFLQNDKVNGVLLCSSISKNRVTLGASVIAMLASKGFVGDSKWGEFIFVGTQADRASAKEIKNFKTDTLKTLNLECSGDIQKVVAISINEEKPDTHDTSELIDMIGKLPGKVVEYKAPPAKELSEEIGKIMAIDPVVVEKEIITYRDRIVPAPGIGPIIGDIFKDVGKGLATTLTVGGLQWDGDAPKFGWK